MDKVNFNNLMFDRDQIHLLNSQTFTILNGKEKKIDNKGIQYSTKTLKN
jgi:hypothetical protein